MAQLGLADFGARTVADLLGSQKLRLGALGLADFGASIAASLPRVPESWLDVTDWTIASRQRLPHMVDYMQQMVHRPQTCFYLLSRRDELLGGVGGHERALGYGKAPHIAAP